MKEQWQAIEDAFSRRGIDPHGLFLPPACDDDFSRLQSVTSLSLPAEAESFYRLHNGQQLGMNGVLFGIELLSIDRMIKNWRNWEAISNDGLNQDLADSMSSSPPGFIKPMYVNLRWLPLTHDQGGNHIGIDFDPGPSGGAGQIIIFGRDEDTKRILAPTFTAFIEMWIDELKTIDWTLDAQSGWQIHDRDRGEAHYHEWPRNVAKD